MRSIAKTVASACVLGVLVGPGPAVSAQVAVDRVLQRFGNHVVTELDVRRARLLGLVPDDDGAQRALENHLLMADEVARFKPDPPDDAAIAAERRAWQARVVPGGDVEALFARAGAGEAELAAWFSQDLLIKRHLDRLFGRMPASERQAAIDEWVANLRARAGLR